MYNAGERKPQLLEAPVDWPYDMHIRQAMGMDGYTKK